VVAGNTWAPAGSVGLEELAVAEESDHS
jgi:hypothetical protein